MQWRLTLRNGIQRRARIPLLSNLFFAYSTRQILQHFVDADPHLQFNFNFGGPSHEPMVVPDRQMRLFIQAVESSLNPIYLAPAEFKDIPRGTQIRIHGGPLDGVEGTFVRVHGSRTRRLVVVIPELLAVAVEVPLEFIEVIKE